MRWRSEGHRDVYFCGDIPVGAVFSHVDQRGRARWRLWLNGKETASEGLETNYEKAQRTLENRFQAFLEQAELRPVGFRRRSK